MNLKAIEYCKKHWGWFEPSEDVIEQAVLLCNTQTKNWRTGDFLKHLAILPESRIDSLIESADQKKGLFFDKLVSSATATEKELLIEARNRVLAFTLNIQCVNDIGSQITVHPIMANKDVLSECSRLNAVICIIQETTPVVVFAEHSSLYTDFSSLSGTAKQNNPIFRQLKDHRLVCALASKPEMVLEAKHSRFADEGEDEKDNIVKDFELKKEPLRAKLALIHNEGLKLNATDIHIIPEVNSPLVRVRLRVFKVMVDLPKSFWLERDEYFAIRDFLVTRSGASQNSGALQRTGDGRYTYMSESRKIEVRGAFCDKGTELSLTKALITIRLRVIPQETGSVNLDSIGVPGHIKEYMHQSLLSESGLVVMVGPTGSGKSTTLFGLVDLHRQIHGDSVSRLSIEDPIERWAEGIDQVQIKRLPTDKQNENLFLEYLRTYVRMDPDFILMGEIRDAETAEMAAQQAITGHKALTTIHAGNVVEALQRLLNMVQSPSLKQMIIDAMDHLFGQRLIPKLCECGPIRDVTSQERSRMEKFLEDSGISADALPSKVRDLNDNGCSKCKHLGVIGVLPCHEVLAMTREVKNLAIEGGLSNFNKIKALRPHTIEEAAIKHISNLSSPLSALFTAM